MVVKNTTSKEFAYLRVSDKDQNEARQQDAIAHLNLDERNVEIEKVSGKNFKDRPKWQKLKAQFRAGDTLYIKELDRLGRNAEEIKAEWKELIDMGVSIEVLDMPILNTRQYKDVTGMEKVIATIILELFSYMAQMERERTAKRRDEGIASARLRGMKFGAPKKKFDGFDNMYAKVRTGEMSAAEAMRQLGMKKNTYYRRIKEIEN